MRYHKLMRIRSGRVWQYRFWDHVIRDERDFESHFHYVHYNPAKHGYVRKPYDWNYSSMKDYMDIYDRDWAPVEKECENADFGE